MGDQNQEKQKVTINVTTGGPYLVRGSCKIIDKDGTESTKEGSFALCRCGGSKNKPFCDGTHKNVEFDK